MGYNPKIPEEDEDLLLYLQSTYHFEEHDFEKLQAVIDRAKVDCVSLNHFPSWLVNYYRETIV